MPVISLENYPLLKKKERKKQKHRTLKNKEEEEEEVETLQKQRSKNKIQFPNHFCHGMYEADSTLWRGTSFLCCLVHHWPFFILFGNILCVLAVLPRHYTSFKLRWRVNLYTILYWFREHCVRVAIINTMSNIHRNSLYIQ